MEELLQSIETLRNDMNVSHSRTLALLAKVERLANQTTPALMNAAKAVEQARNETRELARMYKAEASGFGFLGTGFGGAPSKFWQNLQNMADDLAGEDRVSESVQRELYGNQTDDDWFARLK